MSMTTAQLLERMRTDCVIVAETMELVSLDAPDDVVDDVTLENMRDLRVAVRSGHLHLRTELLYLSENIGDSGHRYIVLAENERVKTLVTNHTVQ